MPTDGKIKEWSLDEVMETLTEQQAKFILQASVIAGHLPRYWLEEGVKLARMVKHD